MGFGKYKISVDEADQNIQHRKHNRGPMNAWSKYKRVGPNHAGVKATVSRTRLPVSEFPAHHYPSHTESPLGKRGDDHSLSFIQLLWELNLLRCLKFPEWCLAHCKCCVSVCSIKCIFKSHIRGCGLKLASITSQKGMAFDTTRMYKGLVQTAGDGVPETGHQPRMEGPLTGGSGTFLPAPVSCLHLEPLSSRSPPPRDFPQNEQDWSLLI